MKWCVNQVENLKSVYKSTTKHLYILNSSMVDGAGVKKN